MIKRRVNHLSLDFMDWHSSYRPFGSGQCNWYAYKCIFASPPSIESIKIPFQSFGIQFYYTFFPFLRIFIHRSVDTGIGNESQPMQSNEFQRYRLRSFIAHFLCTVCVRTLCMIRCMRAPCRAVAFAFAFVHSLQLDKCSNFFFSPLLSFILLSFICSLAATIYWLKTSSLIWYVITGMGWSEIR